jgi:hypothetical protein
MKDIKKGSVLLAITSKLAMAGEYESALELAESIAHEGYKAKALKAIARAKNSQNSQKSITEDAQK